jgi:hypothetical protein
MFDGRSRKLRAMSARILLVTSFPWTRADRLAGAFASAGAQVDALYPAGHAIRHSRFLDRSFSYRGLAPQASLREAMAESAPDLVIPCDDRISAELAALHAEAGGSEKALLVRSLGQPSLYPDMTTRRVFLSEAAKAGAPSAEMTDISSKTQLDAAIARLGLPLVLKSDHSWGGAGVVIAHNTTEAHDAFTRMARTVPRWRQVLRALRRRDAYFLHAALKPQKPVVGVQRFITGLPATTSMACWNGKMLAANHFDVILTQHDKGPACVLDHVTDAQMDDAARAVAARFQLSGLHGLDYVRDQDGQVHLLEINPRATPTAHLVFGDGQDLCGALLAAMGHAPAQRPVVIDSRIALFPQEVTRDPGSSWMQDAFHDVPWEDPETALASLPADRQPDWLIRALNQAARPHQRAANRA